MNDFYKLILGRQTFNFILLTLDKQLEADSDNEKLKSLIDFLCAVENANNTSAQAVKMFNELDKASKELEEKHGK